jgi:hypothetical protein
MLDVFGVLLQIREVPAPLKPNDLCMRDLVGNRAKIRVPVREVIVAVNR